MPKRLKRYAGRGDLHFITFSCYQRRAFLQSKRAKNLFVKILSEVRASQGFRLVGYVVMPEHVHLLIDEPAGALPAKFLQMLKQRVSRRLRGKRRAAQGQLELRFPVIPGHTGGSGSGGITTSMCIPKRSCAKNWTTCTRIL